MKIEIRPVRMSDAMQITEIMIQEKVMPYVVSLPSVRVERFENILKAAAPEQHEFVAVHDGVVIGFAGLHQGKGRRSHSGTLFIMIHEEFQGKGAGSALIKKLLDMADNWLMLERVELTVLDNNLKAKKLYESLGFVDEGFSKGTIVQHGRYAGEYRMARYRPGGLIEERMKAESEGKD
ncbi:GNAT family N-acetyltransferase [Rossellomorea vietnamensis]|uniref:GNAT family N-acetyltransferase n=1 Tax=Rossellomorea vietnamensis TaxID=218284 RepID=A0A5D4NQG5_9BACI|nr:GNAT family N-acetyltransferase [Rossellomorea vietnamensis]TYS16140.1 GNAT family N-acetyltransferase [Rossellomorea vietnamensis]